MNIQHSMRRDDWRTPEYILDMVRSVIGPIGLDPCSSKGGQEIVQATRYLTAEDDALKVKWPEGLSVYMNPPGGKLGNKSKAGLFWSRLMTYRDQGSMVDAIVALFSVESFQVTQHYSDLSVLDFPFCVPRQRIKWVHPFEDKAAPSHSNAFAYVPGTRDCTELFVEQFSRIGKCVTTHRVLDKTNKPK